MAYFSFEKTNCGRNFKCVVIKFRFVFISDMVSSSLEIPRFYPG